MRLTQLETPALILDLDVFEQNIKIMKNFLESSGLANSGIEDILIANQIVEQTKIARAAYLAG